MTQTQHTPGPWAHQVAMTSDNNHESYILADSCSKIIAYTRRCEDWLPLEQNTANARLIAAAPELLRCLEGYLHFISSCNPSAGQDVMAVLAKAKGGAA